GRRAHVLLAGLRDVVMNVVGGLVLGALLDELLVLELLEALGDRLAVGRQAFGLLGVNVLEQLMLLVGELDRGRLLGGGLLRCRLLRSSARLLRRGLLGGRLLGGGLLGRRAALLARLLHCH